ncbi:hypothetical protein [Jannaschia seohaensis]|uniref:Uncharacterized protein n=1 Tax=Jannaschia seohaensis TaxID=475081 RepID=A0A2Y9AUG5_9RHOB|nr:hypothetical protein [Jannaschia seohaensis]PWJ19247.1 hypothetical protein BCF38_104181 [Jannaschia seohaensis]SSA45909.1 hypothetical protein SAMN05421539_104181 [Jannaschia seohaensis]
MTSTRVNAPNSGTDGNPSAVALPDVRAAIVYQSRRVGEPFEIVLRLREADGGFSQPMVLDAVGSTARMPEATLLNDGSLLVSWLAETSSGGEARTNVLGQRFDMQGGALSDSFTLSSRALSEGRYLDTQLEARREGGFVVQVVGVEATDDRWENDWDQAVVFPRDDSITPLDPEGPGWRTQLIPLA